MSNLVKPSYSTDSLYCGKWEKSCCDLELGPIVPNVDFVQDILICYVAFEFQDPKSKRSQDILFYRHTETQKDRHTGVLYSCDDDIPTIIRLKV